MVFRMSPFKDQLILMAKKTAPYSAVRGDDQMEMFDQKDWETAIT
jgi:hypothetical protein